MARTPRPAFEIARREFLEHVLSWRFLLALTLSTLILVTSVVALSASYREDLDAFATRQDELESQDDGFSETLLQVNRWMARPNVLSIFVGGAGDEYRSVAGTATPFGGEGGAAPDSGSGSPTNTRFAPLDLGFVAAVVMTFMAVIFSFDAISGERERGTLKLLLANPVPKDAVLLGKYMGGMASVGLAFAVSVLVALAALSLSGVSMPAGAWSRLGAILGLFALLLSAFYLIGLLVSSLCRRSGTSLLAMTMVWLVLVFGVGNVAAVAAKAASDVPSGADLQEQIRAIDERLFNTISELQDEMFQLVEKRQRGNLTSAEQARLTELETIQGGAFDEAEAERGALLSDARRRLDDQLLAAESIASASPAEAFRSLSTAIARSDYWTYRDVAQAAEEYRREVARMREELADETGGGFRRVVFVGGGGARGLDDGFDPPEFDYAPASLGEAVSSARGLRDALVLIGYNVAAFVAAYVAFLRYDVR